MSLTVDNFPHLLTLGGPWQHALLLTYQFEPRPFFEIDILPRLRSEHPITVVCDAECYRGLLTATRHERRADLPLYAGTRYNIEGLRVARGGTFHPKLYLLMSEEQVRLVVGSANLTGAGFKSNAELCCVITIEREDTEDLVGQVLLNDLLDLLQFALLERNDLGLEVPSGVTRAVERMFNTPWLEDRTLPAKIQSFPRLLHSARGALLRQILEAIPGRPLTLEVLSPYYDSDLDLLNELHATFNSMTLYVPTEDSTFPSAAASDDSASWIGSEVLRGVRASEHDRQRFPHAKMYRITTDQGAFRISASANCTHAGLTESGPTRNFEVALVLEDDLGGPFLEGRPFECRPVELNELQVSVPMTAVERDSESRLLEDALRGALLQENRIVLSLSAGFLNRYAPTDFSLWTHPGDLHTPVDEEEGVFWARTPMSIGSDDSIMVWLRQRANAECETGRCFLSRPEMRREDLPTLGLSEFSECRRLGGKEGIERAIQYAKQLGRDDWLFYLFSCWDLSRIFHASEEAEVDEEAQQEDETLPRIPTSGRSRATEPPDLSRLRRNLDIYQAEDEFNSHLRDYFGSFDDDYFGSGVEATAYRVAQMIDTTLPLSIFTVVTFQKKLAQQERFKREGWPVYRHLHILKLMGRAVSEISQFLERLDAWWARARQTVSERDWLVHLKACVTIDLWEKVKEPRVFAQMARDCQPIRIFSVPSYVGEVIRETICERAEQVTRHRDEVLGLYEELNLFCPYIDLLTQDQVPDDE